MNPSLNSLCRFHAEHEHRISANEKDIKELQMNQKNPVVMVAIIGLIGTLFSGCMAFLAVIMAPVVRAWLGV